MCGAKTKYDLYFSLMNILLKIKFKRFGHCFCNLLNQEKCRICSIIIDFDNFEDELTENKKNVDFLKKYQSGLYP